MAEHYREVCYECEKVVSQCRCMSRDKKIIPVLCDECFNKGVKVLSEDNEKIKNFKDYLKKKCHRD